MSDPESTKLLKQIDKKLGVLITLNAVNLSTSKELDNPTKVRLLSLAGFTSDEIGKMIGVRGDTVRHIRSEAGRKKGETSAKGGEESVK
jgi:transcription antitermination factor NusA-like protein